MKSKVWMSPASLGRLLEEASPGNDPSAATVYVPPGQANALESAGAGLSGDLKRRATQLLELCPEAREWGAGYVVFAAGERALVVLPPFPVAQYSLYDRWNAAPITELLLPERTIGVVLLRLGRFAVGVFHGPRLLASKSDTRYVKGRHSAGGSSQRRFERIRDRQIREIYDKVCTVMRERLAPFEGALEYVSLGGERHTLNGFLGRCPYVRQLGVPLLPRTLDVRVPRRDSLEQAIHAVYESQVITIE